MKTEASVRGQMLAVLQENPGDEFRPGELTSAVNVDLVGAGLPELAQILAPEIEAGRIVCRKAGRGTFYSAPATEAAQPQEEFRAAHWSDGDLDLYGLIELDDGGYRLTPEMVAKVKRLIAWSPAT